MIIEKHSDYSKAFKHIRWPINIDTNGRSVRTAIEITETDSGEILIWLDTMETNKPTNCDVAYGGILHIQIKSLEELVLKENEIKLRAIDFFKAQFK